MSVLAKLSAEDQTFEPPVAIKRAFLSVRHRAYTRGSTTLPGVFNLEGEGWDTFWFVIAIGLELIGMILLVIAADFSAMWATITVAFALFLDVLIAYGAHSARPHICEREIQKVLAVLGKEPGRVQDRLDDEIASMRRWPEVPFQCFLALSAAGKIAGFFLAYVIRGGHSPDPLLGLLVLVYISVAIVHIYRTGYAVAAAVLLVRLNLAYNRYLSGGPRAMDYTFHTAVHHPKHLPNLPKDIEVGRHVLMSDGLHTKGILMDREVQGICDKMPSEYKNDVAVLCLAAQYQILNSAPSPPGAV